MKTSKAFTSFASLMALFILTLAASFSAHAQSKGMTFQGYLKDSGGNLVNATGLTVTSQLLSPNDCVLMEETHSSVAITEGFFTVVIGKGTRTGTDKGLAMKDVFSNSTARTAFDTAAGAVGSCNYTPTAADARKVKLKFTVGADAISADFNIRGNAFAVWSEASENSEKLAGKASSDYLQVNTGTGLTQSSLQALVTSLAGGFGTVTGVTSANSYLGITNGSTAPVLTVNVGTAANTVAAGNDSRFGNALKLQNVNVDATAPTSGQVLKYDGAKWAPAADATGGGGGGGLSGVTSTNAYLTVANGTTAPDLTLHVGTAPNTVAAGDDSRFGNALKISSVNIDTTGIASGKILKYDGTKWAIANDDSGGAPSGSATGDLSGSFPNPSVVAIRGVAVAATTAVSGQVYKYNGTDWSPVYIGLADLKKSGGGSQLPGSQCAANEKMDWVAASDAFVCTAIDSLDAGKITTGTLASAQLPTVPLNKGGTGQTTAADSFNALSPLTTKGDLVTYASGANARLGVGADGKFLRADSGQTSGLAWGDVVATDLSSMVSTGIVQRNGSNSYSSVTVNAPISYSAGALGLALGAGLTTSGSNLVADFGSGSGKVAQGNDSRFPSGTCASGNKMRWDGSAWQCETDNSTDTTKVSKTGDTMTGGLELAPGSGATDTAVSGLALSTTNTSYTTKGRLGSNSDALYITQNLQNNGGGTFVQDNAGKAAAMISLVSGNADSRIIFYTRDANTPALPLNRMIIDKSGNVGVGTASPAVPLDVSGTARVLASVEGAASVVSSSTAYPIPDLTRNIRRITLTANTTITLPDASSLPTDAAYSLTIRVKQDATGSRTLAWAGNTQTIKWDTGSAPAVATAANTETIYQFFIIGGESVWYGSMVWKEN